MSSYKKVSLSEINQSIDTPNNNHFWQNLKAFLGPGALVAVGYMDPGNWITSVVGGGLPISIVSCLLSLFRLLLLCNFSRWQESLGL